MIPVVQLVKSLRYALGDMQGVNVSDYELLEAINQAASLLYGRLSERYVYSVLKSTTLNVDDDGSTGLPSDFVRVHQVLCDEGVSIPVTYKPTAEGTYRIIGEVFYAPEGVYGLEYYYVPLRVTSLSDSLDVPMSMKPYVEQIALLMSKRDLANAEGVVQLCVRTLGGRDITHYENSGPVNVLGGHV